MSDTPKTDEKALFCGSWLHRSREDEDDQEVVPADFARAQERRIAELEKDSKKYRWLISQPVNAVAEPIQKMWFTVGIEGRPYPTPDEWDAAITASMGEQ